MLKTAVTLVVIFGKRVSVICHLYYLHGIYNLRATEALQSCREKLASFRQDPLNVCVSGIGNFRNSIVFAKLSEGATLSRLEEIVGTSLQ